MSGGGGGVDWTVEGGVVEGGVGEGGVVEGGGGTCLPVKSASDSSRSCSAGSAMPST